jgi:hypothetical protein
MDKFGSDEPMSQLEMDILSATRPGRLPRQSEEDLARLRAEVARQLAAQDIHDLTWVQGMYLELIAAVQYNNFDGRETVRALLEHRALWDSVYATHQLVPRHDWEAAMHEPNVAPPVAPLSNAITGYLTTDTLFILTDASRLEALTTMVREQLHPDDVYVVPNEQIRFSISIVQDENTRVLELWWD